MFSSYVLPAFLWCVESEIQRRRPVRQETFVVRRSRLGGDPSDSPDLDTGASAAVRMHHTLNHEHALLCDILGGAWSHRGEDLAIVSGRTGAAFIFFK